MKPSSSQGDEREDGGRHRSGSHRRQTTAPLNCRCHRQHGQRRIDSQRNRRLSIPGLFAGRCALAGTRRAAPLIAPRRIRNDVRHGGSMRRRAQGANRSGGLARVSRPGPHGFLSNQGDLHARHAEGTRALVFIFQSICRTLLGQLGRTRASRSVAEQVLTGGFLGEKQVGKKGHAILRGRRYASGAALRLEGGALPLRDAPFSGGLRPPSAALRIRSRRQAAEAMHSRTRCAVD